MGVHTILLHIVVCFVFDTFIILLKVFLIQFNP
jgi:hypothetical protein